MVRIRDSLDVVIAAAVAVVVGVSAWPALEPAPLSHVVGLAVLAAGALSLLARRTHPTIVLAITAVSLPVAAALGTPGGGLSFLVAAYSAIQAGRRWATAISCAVVLGLLPAVFFFVSSVPGGAAFPDALRQSRGVIELAWLVAAIAAGEAVRQVERRAQQAEVTREEAARRRADEVRLRIARELHDSLTHHISVIKVHAEVGVHRATRRGEDLEHLLAIRAGARDASADLSRALSPRLGDAPPPGLDDLQELIDRVRATGVDATLTMDAAQVRVPDEVGWAAYRIVQEALTNVVRHANSAPTTVLLTRDRSSVIIEVCDEGDPRITTSAAPGVGLIGMGERVTALGGVFSAQRRDAGGFLVRAVLPVDTP